jgi:hypothetical protein
MQLKSGWSAASPGFFLRLTDAFFSFFVEKYCRGLTGKWALKITGMFLQIEVKQWFKSRIL